MKNKFGKGGERKKEEEAKVNLCEKQKVSIYEMNEKSAVKFNYNECIIGVH